MHTRVVLIGVGVGAVALSGACNRGEDRSSTRIRVIDSTYTESWQPMEDTGTVYRLEIVSPLGADTIRNVIPGCSRFSRWPLHRVRRRGYDARESRDVRNRARSQDRTDCRERTRRRRLRL